MLEKPEVFGFASLLAVEPGRNLFAQFRHLIGQERSQTRIVSGLPTAPVYGKRFTTNDTIAARRTKLPDAGENDLTSFIPSTLSNPDSHVVRVRRCARHRVESDRGNSKPLQIQRHRLCDFLIQACSPESRTVVLGAVVTYAAESRFVAG